jgi:membrane-associated phospholipid phosphatase
MKRLTTQLHQAWYRLGPTLVDEFHESLLEAWCLVRIAAAWCHRYSGWLMLMQLGIALAIVIAIYPYDAAWLHAVRGSSRALHHALLNTWARKLSDFGDFHRLNVVILLLFIYMARVTREARWRRLAMMCLLSSTLSGLSAVTLRVMLGRARPIAGVADGFYGPDLRANYQGCPSGHTATAFGAAVPLIIADPVVGVPLLGVASGVAWSRVCLNKHYPSDIAAGVWVTLWFGLPLGLAARYKRPRVRGTAALLAAPIGASLGAPPSSSGVL